MDGFNKKRKIMGSQQGFSLVELMVVVAIIGILSALAIPRFRIFQAKARQAEAKTNLSHIYTLQQSYHGDEDTYINIPQTGDGPGVCPSNDLGFEINPCGKARYTYEATGTLNTFTATAVSGANANNKVLPGCPAETWTINEDKELTVANDVTKGC